MIRSAEIWLKRLACESTEQNEAIGELREILIRGLRSGLPRHRQADAAFIEDMVQLALLRIIERLDTFNGHSRFTTWAMAITVRIAYNELRRREWKNVSLEALRAEGCSIEADAGIETESPAESMVRRDFNSVLRQMIETELTSRQRDVLIAELNGMPQEEIVRQLGGTRNSVYKLCHDARKALRQALKRNGIASFGQIELIGRHRSKGNQ